MFIGLFLYLFILYICIYIYSKSIMYTYIHICILYKYIMYDILEQLTFNLKIMKTIETQKVQGQRGNQKTAKTHQWSRFAAHPRSRARGGTGTHPASQRSLGLSWVAVKELKLNYHNKETLFFDISLSYGIYINLHNSSLVSWPCLPGQRRPRVPPRLHPGCR